jgi:hypothetical protein
MVCKMVQKAFWRQLTFWRLAQCVLLTKNLIMKTIEIKQKLVEEALDQLKAAQQDSYVQSTQNVIDELELALRQPLVTNRTYSVDEVKILLEKQKQACANEFIHVEMSMELAKRKVLQTPIVSF